MFSKKIFAKTLHFIISLQQLLLLHWTIERFSSFAPEFGVSFLWAIFERKCQNQNFGGVSQLCKYFSTIKSQGSHFSQQNLWMRIQWRNELVKHSSYFSFSCIPFLRNFNKTWHFNCIKHCQNLRKKFLKITVNAFGKEDAVFQRKIAFLSMFPGKHNFGFKNDIKH